jgi:hypothetical protein
MNKFNMKIHLLIILLGMTSYCFSCGSDGDGIIEVSKQNNLGVTTEILKDGKILLTLPNKFKEGDFAYAYLLIGDYDTSEPDIAVPIANYSGNEYIDLSLNLSDEMSKIATIIASYTIKGTLCYAGSITLKGFDKLEFSPHWRDKDISNLFSKIKKLKKGMTLREVWKTLGQPHYESTLFPRSLSDYKNEHALIYNLTKKLNDSHDEFPVIRIVFNNDGEFYKIEADNLENYSLPENLYTPN